MTTYIVEIATSLLQVSKPRFSAKREWTQLIWVSITTNPTGYQGGKDFLLFTIKGSVMQYKHCPSTKDGDDSDDSDDNDDSDDDSTVSCPAIKRPTGVGADHVGKKFSLINIPAGATIGLGSTCLNFKLLQLDVSTSALPREDISHREGTAHNIWLVKKMRTSPPNQHTPPQQCALSISSLPAGCSNIALNDFGGSSSENFVTGNFPPLRDNMLDHSKERCAFSPENYDLTNDKSWKKSGSTWAALSPDGRGAIHYRHTSGAHLRYDASASMLLYLPKLASANRNTSCQCANTGCN